VVTLLSHRRLVGGDVDRYVFGSQPRFLLCQDIRIRLDRCLAVLVSSRTRIDFSYSAHLERTAALKFVGSYSAPSVTIRGVSIACVINALRHYSRGLGITALT